MAFIWFLRAAAFSGFKIKSQRLCYTDTDRRGAGGECRRVGVLFAKSAAPHHESAAIAYETRRPAAMTYCKKRNKSGKNE